MSQYNGMDPVKIVTVRVNLIFLICMLFHFYKLYCFTVHFNSLNVTHQLMQFQCNNILV